MRWRGIRDGRARLDGREGVVAGAPGTTADHAEVIGPGADAESVAGRHVVSSLHEARAARSESAVFESDQAVRAGKEVVLTERGHPIAVIKPISSGHSGGRPPGDGRRR